MYKRGDILRLSEEGISRLGAEDERRIARLRIHRFEYCCSTRRDVECLTVKRILAHPTYLYYEHYHHSFLETA